MSTLTTQPPAATDGPFALDQLADLIARSGREEPAWLGELRRAAATRFAEFGLPGPTDEEWRYTSVKPIRDLSFRFASEDAASAEIPDTLSVPVEGAFRLFIADGHPIADRSDTSGLPDGVRVQPLGEALAEADETLKRVLSESVRSARDGFEALAGAAMDTGVVVRLDAGVKLERPIVIAYACSARREPTLSTPRTVIIAGEGAEGTVVEDHFGPEGAVYLTNSFTDIDVAPHAHVTHVLLERESADAFHVSTLRTRQATESKVSSHRLIFGGGLVRNNVVSTLEGDRSDCDLYGLYVGTGRQHLDNHMRVVHAAEQCPSRQQYRGILADRARGVFTGRIYVAREGQRTDAYQNNQNLLLSPTAQAVSKPQLEIYADDVKCSHGSTTGELSEDALFYLRARGLTEAQARLALLFAFALENIDEIPLESVRAWAREDIARRLRAALEGA